jgi:hypothetical protein
MINTRRPWHGFIAALAATIVAGGCGGESPLQGTSAATVSVSEVRWPYERADPVAITATPEHVWVLALGPSDGSNIWEIDRATLDMEPGALPFHAEALFAAGERLWVVSYDPVKERSTVGLVSGGGADARINAKEIAGGCERLSGGTTFAGELWTFCDSRLLSFSPRERAGVEEVRAAPSLLFSAGETLWLGEDDGFRALAGAEEGRRIPFVAGDAGPYTVAGNEVWALTSTPDSQALARVNLTTGENDLFRLPATDAAPNGIAVVDDEVWITTIGSARIDRYARSSPSKRVGVIENPNYDEVVKLVSDPLGQRAWLVVRKGNMTTIVTAAVERS